MKIAFIVGAFPALSTTFILSQITELLDNGHDVEIFAALNPNEPKTHPDVQKYHLMDRVHYFNVPHNKIKRILKAVILLVRNIYKHPLKLAKSLNVLNYGNSALSLRLLYALIPFLKKTFDIIYCHFGPAGILGAYIKEITAQGKVITTFHGYDMSAFISKKGKRIYDDLFLRGDLFMPISNHWRDKLIELGCDKNKIIVHRMGIDLKKFNFFAREIQSRNPVKLLTVGRLTEKKGHRYAIQAMAKLAKTYKNIEYIIAGDGPLKGELEDLVTEFEVNENVIFCGAVEQNEVLKLYQHAHVFIHPSVTASNGDQEGIPVVLMEAQATGLPVVSTYHSGIPEVVIDGKSGFLVNERDVYSLSERLAYLIKHSEIWAEMGNFGRRIIEEMYDIKKLNTRLEKIYEFMLCR